MCKQQSTCASFIKLLGHDNEASAIGRAFILIRLFFFLFSLFVCVQSFIVVCQFNNLDNEKHKLIRLCRRKVIPLLWTQVIKAFSTARSLDVDN